MADREEVNRRLRERVHNELDQAGRLLAGICDDTVRAAGQRKYDQLFKLVEDRSKRVRSDSLKQIIIAAEILKESLNNKFIEQENAKTVEKPASKIEKFDILDEEIYKLANSYDSERIALKYRRKKVEVPNDMLKVPNVPTKRASSPLFHRRHEVFLPQKSTAATYGEHKRQMLLMRPEAIVPPTRSLLPANRPLSADPRVQHYRRVAKFVPPLISESRPILSAPSYQNNEIAQTGKSKTDLVQVVRSISDTNEGTKNISEATPQCVETSSEKTCNLNQKPTMKENTNNLATSVNDTTGKGHESVTKATIDSEQVTDVHALNTRCAHDTSSQSHTSSHKQTKSSKSGKLTRELKDLISDASEYMTNCKRKEQINLANNQPKIEQALLQQFGINKTVKVVLKDAVTNGNVASAQMQCKPLHAPKQSSCEITLRRRQSVCVDNRAVLEIQDLQKSKKRRKKTSKDEDSVIRLPKAVKSTSRGQGKNKEAILHSIGKLNSDTASKKQNQSSTPPEPAKTPTKRKLRRKSVTDVPKKKASPDVPQGESISLRTIETTSIANYSNNNKEEIHCHSEYMTQCRFCDFKDVRQTDIVSHYVYHHPASEVIVSRITPEQARIVRQSPFAVDGKRVVSRYGYETISFRCHFCEMRNTLKESDWVHHLVNHTGEYRFRCRACPAVARTADESVTHEEICGDPEMIVCNDIYFEENHVYGYMCEVCNFIQIRRFNMDRHLRREHPFEAATCIRFSLVNYVNDHEDAAIGSYYTSVKMEPKENDDCSGILNSIPFVKDEKIDDEEVLDKLPFEPIVSKQEVFLNFAEKEEPNLPELLEENERTLEQTLMSFNDCENSNDSNCTLPMPSFEEETMQNLGTVLEAQICEQGIILKDGVNENKMNDISRAFPPTATHPKDPVPTTNNVKFLQIRPRMLSGDSLSNQFNIEQIVAHKPHNANASCLMPAAHTKMVYPINVIVKPWIEHKSVRFSSNYLKKITYKCLGSFYKCMGDGCSFHSDENENMRQHLANHWNNDTQNRVSHENTWLECCYCQYSAVDGDSLLSHLNVVHKNCAFQCNRCFYRSREASSVVIHQSTYHVDDEACNMILECTKQFKKFSLVDQDAIIEQMNSTVEELKCTACNSKKYFDLLEYKTHLLAHNEQFISCHICHSLIPKRCMLKHLKSHNIFLYQCVHCVYGTDQKYVIKNHVSREHAEKICCFHMREVKRTNSVNMPNAFVPIPLRPFVRVEETISNDRLRTYC